MSDGESKMVGCAHCGEWVDTTISHAAHLGLGVTLHNECVEPFGLSKGGSGRGPSKACQNCGIDVSGGDECMVGHGHFYCLSCGWLIYTHSPAHQFLNKQVFDGEGCDE